MKQFKYEEPQNLKEKLFAIKRGIYNLEKEDMLILDILKDLESNPKFAYKKIPNLGILKFNPL